MSANLPFDIGTITGILGAVTGVAGSIMGFIAYRHSKELKAADRRIELEKLRNATHLVCVQLVDLLPQAQKSRHRVLSAIGKVGSGDMQLFEEAFEKDSARSFELSQQVPATDNDFKTLSRDELEDKIIELDRTKGWIEELFQKYQDSMLWDQERSKEIRQQHAPR